MLTWHILQDNGLTHSLRILTNGIHWLIHMTNVSSFAKMIAYETLAYVFKDE